MSILLYILLWALSGLIGLAIIMVLDATQSNYPDRTSLISALIWSCVGGPVIFGLALMGIISTLKHRN